MFFVPYSQLNVILGMTINDYGGPSSSKHAINPSSVLLTSLQYLIDFASFLLFLMQFTGLQVLRASQAYYAILCARVTTTIALYPDK